ncbi:hypothetical protein Vretifemale_14582, partial [Volvox reticuliferus]
GIGRTLSVVHEEAEFKPRTGTTGSNSEDFASRSNIKPSEPAASPSALQSQTAVRSTAGSSATEVAAEDCEYDYEPSEAEEDEQQFSTGSGGLVGPVLPPAATASVALEVSMRYGPASEQSSSGYSDDFHGHAGEDTMLASTVEKTVGTAAVDTTASFALARDADKDMQPLMAELRAESSVQKLASQSVERRSSGPTMASVQKEPSAEASSKQRSPPPGEESMSVFSVEEESHTSATVSSEPSAQELSPGLPQQDEAKAEESQPIKEPDDGSDDEYTREFSDLELQSGGADGLQAKREASVVASHPISQPPSPPAHSREEAGSPAAGAAAAAEAEDSDLEEVISDEALDADLDLSDLGLDTPLVTALEGAAAIQQPEGGIQQAALETAPRVQAVRSGEASPSVSSGLDGEESGIIPVPRGRGIWQTHQIESRTWRSQQTPLEEEESLDVDVDLVDVGGPGEGSGLLDALGADLITEASEGGTPSQSFRIRSGDLASGPSSGSPYGVRSALSVRLSTLRESLDHEGEDTETTSEVVTPSATRALHRSSENMFGFQQSQQAEPTPEAAANEEADVDVDENAEMMIPSQSSGSEASFVRPTPATAAEQALEPLVPERTDAGFTTVAAEPSREQSNATAVAAAAEAGTVFTGQIGREVSGAASTRYSDDLEAPPSEGSADRQSVEEYDPYTSALAADDSDELFQVAVAFESQAIGADEDDDGGEEHESSGISTSRLSDDLSKYKATIQPDSDDEAAGRAPTDAAPAAMEATAKDAVAPSPVPTPPAEAEGIPSIEASEIDEEPDVPAGDPFSVDESGDRLPTLQSVTGVLPPAPFVTTAAPAATPSGGRAGEEKGGLTAKAAALGPAAGAVAAAASSPTASSSRSERSSQGALPGETSLGPLPRSGLGDDDEDDGQGLEYRAVYQAHGELAEKEKATGRPAGGEMTASANDGESAGRGGYLEQLRAFADSDDEGDFSRVTSTASLKPMFQALLDQPEIEADVPKGEFESEIEEMLRDAVSRSRSRLVSPLQSRDWALDSDATEQEANTAGSSARVSQSEAPPSSTLAPQTTDADAATPAMPPTELTRENVVDKITESTVKAVDEDASAASPLACQVADDSSHVSMGGEASISISVDDLEGDIVLDAEDNLNSGGGLDLPSPLPSDSGSVGSPKRSYEPPGASKLSGPPSSAVPALGPERSDRDLALTSSGPDDALADSGVGLTSDEDLGWGGAELEEDWQPDVSEYIAPEMDQAAIERENAPAVSTGAVAVAEYASQVMEQFMENRPEFLMPGAEPLSLEGFLDQERRLVHASEAQHIHNKMVYDAINEALLSIYRAANRIQTQPWLRRNRFIKPLPSPVEMTQQVQQQLRAWAAMRMRDPAETDKVLVMDAQEDERARADLAVEEAEVQREVADLIWADLMADTAQQLAEIEQILAPASFARSGMSGSGRRRLNARAP